MPDLRPGRVGVAVALVLYGAASSARAAHAQLPSLPAGQSAFPAPGIAVALNGARGDGRTVAALAGATGVRRLQLTAAVGLPGAPSGFERSGVSGGARLAARLYRTPQLGLSAFAGYGAERMRLLTPASSRPTGNFSQVPVGVSAGYRGLAGDRPYALSLAPMYVYTRWRISDTARTRSAARVAALAELAVTSSIGLGVALETGAGGPLGSPLAASRTVVGVGLSYAIHRRSAR